MEDGKWTQSEVGSPQGATASPLLANVYLHNVHDFILGFQHRSDAEQFLAELRE